MKSCCASFVFVALCFIQCTQAQEQSTRKPQVTTFLHQTLGESWEDFVRITKINVTTCMAEEKPLPLLWCETFKKIEAGEIATLSSSTTPGSGSLSLVFSKKKLLQVVEIGNADWTQSVADLTQRYGAPDTQTQNSAVWSFADGGGIASSGQSGNLVHINFYSKDGKPTTKDYCFTYPGRMVKTSDGKEISCSDWFNQGTTPSAIPIVGASAYKGESSSTPATQPDPSTKVRVTTIQTTKDYCFTHPSGMVITSEGRQIRCSEWYQQGTPSATPIVVESVHAPSSPPPQSDFLTTEEVQKAAQSRGGKGVTITAGGGIGQDFAAVLENQSSNQDLHVAQYMSIHLFTTESWIALTAQMTRQQYRQFDPSDISESERLRGLTVVALGGAYGSNAGPRCNSVTRVALISDKKGAVVAEAHDQLPMPSSWSNVFGASASCDAIVARFEEADVQRVTSAAQKGEYFIGVFSGSDLLFMYKIKEKYLKELGR